MIRDNEGYIRFCLDCAEDKLKDYSDIDDVAANEGRINKYEHLDQLSEPKGVAVIDGNTISESDIERAKKCVLDGRFFAEHAAAGEATRLGLGTKYLLNIPKMLSTARIAKLISEEKKVYVSEEKVIEEAGCRPEELLPISLGVRHMLQYSFDIHKLAIENGADPDVVLKRQKMLIVLNETTYEKICREIMMHNFYGFNRDNVFFMVQRSYHGISFGDDGLFYDPESPKRLHNHGQMVIQETLDDEIFTLDESGKRKYLKADEFGEILKGMDDKQSFCIEDVVFLTSAIDFGPLAFALKKGDDGYRMVMEIVANNPDNPQKGGMCAYDDVLGRNVMIESFQLMGIENKDIIYLNKNFNHYPTPFDSWSELKKNALNMPITIKDGHIYFQPIQGDINFLVKTEFVQNKILKPIKSWKSPATTPLTIKYMKSQDNQDGFEEYAKRYVSF